LAEYYCYNIIQRKHTALVPCKKGHYSPLHTYKVIHN